MSAVDQLKNVLRVIRQLSRSDSQPQRLCDILQADAVHFPTGGVCVAENVKVFNVAEYHRAMDSLRRVWGEGAIGLDVRFLKNNGPVRITFKHRPLNRQF